MKAIRLEDDNAWSRWSPITEGGNIPSLNEVLREFVIGLGAEVLSEYAPLRSHIFQFESGVPIVLFPAGSELVYGRLLTRFAREEKQPK